MLENEGWNSEDWPIRIKKLLSMLYGVLVNNQNGLITERQDLLGLMYQRGFEWCRLAAS